MTFPSDRPPPETAGTQQDRDACGRFAKGRTGNPAGRPKGARNKATRAIEALLDGEAEALARKAVEMALAGDPAALRLCLERLLPPRRERPVVLDLPDLANPGAAAVAAQAVVCAVAAGELAPQEAQAVLGLVETHARLTELGELEARVAALEACGKPA